MLSRRLGLAASTVGALLVALILGSGPAPAAPAYGTTEGATSPEPRVLAVTAATWDGDILTMHLTVPERGNLSIGIPVVCGRGRAVACRRRAWIARPVSRTDDLVLRRHLDPRLDSHNRLNLSARLEMADGGLIVGSLRPRVHRTRPH